MNAPIWWVYGLIDPRDRFIFYVGITQDVNKRLRQHISDRSSAAYESCQDIIASGAYPDLIKFMGTLHQEAALMLERHLIIGIPQTRNKTFFAEGYKFWEPIREKMRELFSEDEVQQMGMS